MPEASPPTGRSIIAVEVVVSATVASPLSRAEAERLARAVLRAEGVTRAMLSVTVVGRRRMRALNRRHFRRDRATDVVAFTMAAAAGGRRRGGAARSGAAPGFPVVGDVYVCAPVGAAQARRFGATPRQELRRLVVHGVLHVLGYDHPEGRGRMSSPMWRRQERLLARLARPR
jgi:probable rRNA maturation factor